MQTNTLSLFLASILFFIPGLLLAVPPTLVLDMRNTPELPKNFRVASRPLEGETPWDATGLADMHMAGGAQFSKLGLQSILRKLNTHHLTVIDLRQESHGFLNGNAVSWYGVNNALNASKTDVQIEQAQSSLLERLMRQESVDVALVFKKSREDSVEKAKTVEFSVHEVATESKLVTFMHHQYERLYVQDFHAPSAEQVDMFINRIRHQPKNRWIYIHCRAGMGRTTTFMAMYDMMQNAKQVSFEDIIARQAGIGGKDLAELPEQASHKYNSAVERLEFLKKFYQYARTNKDGFTTAWTTWLKEAKLN